MHAFRAFGLQSRSYGYDVSGIEISRYASPSLIARYDSISQYPQTIQSVRSHRPASVHAAPKHLSQVLRPSNILFPPASARLPRSKVSSHQHSARVEDGRLRESAAWVVCLRPHHAQECVPENLASAALGCKGCYSRPRFSRFGFPTQTQVYRLRRRDEWIQLPHVESLALYLVMA